MTAFVLELARQWPSSSSARVDLAAGAEHARRWRGSRRGRGAHPLPARRSRGSRRWRGAHPCQHGSRRPPRGSRRRYPLGYQNMPISTRVRGKKLDEPIQEGWAAQIPRQAVDIVYPLEGLPRSRHRDGSMYRGTERWKERFHLADRRETRLEPMSLSDSRSRTHGPCQMLQIFSIKLHKIHVDGGLVELYGYIAVRDALDPLLNYVMNLSRDDPVIVEQGSLIKMAGPKRGIQLFDTNIVEYDVRIKTGKQEKDDMQLIDGVTVIDDKDTEDRRVFKGRICGESGIIDITASRLDYAVEATIEVLISEVYINFFLCLSSFTSGLREEIQLFDGVIGKSQDLKRSVVAVRRGTNLDLKFKVGSESFISTEHLCSFTASQFGYVSQEIKTGHALFSVKVTWSTLPG